MEQFMHCFIDNVVDIMKNKEKRIIAMNCKRDYWVNQGQQSWQFMDLKNYFLGQVFWLDYRQNFDCFITERFQVCVEARKTLDFA